MNGWMDGWETRGKSQPTFEYLILDCDRSLIYETHLARSASIQSVDAIWGIFGKVSKVGMQHRDGAQEVRGNGRVN